MTRERKFGEKRLVVMPGDITEQRVDAIVNAANEWLVHGGGVAGAISRAAGPRLQEESSAKAPIRAGEAVATSGGRLPAKHVIHTVGPRGGDEDGDAVLSSAVESSLRVAEENGVRSIAFPAISAGIFGYPLESVARILVGVAAAWLRDPAHAIEEIRFVLFDARTVRAFEAALDAETAAG